MADSVHWSQHLHPLVKGAETKHLSVKKYCLTMQHGINIQCTAGVIQPIYAVTFVQLTLAVLSAELAEPEVFIGSVKVSLLGSS